VYDTYVIRQERLWAEGSWSGYVPMECPELPSALAKLRPGDTKAVLRFAREYGLLGYWHIAKGADGEDGEGEPLDWIWAQAHTLNVCLALTGLLEHGEREPLEEYLAGLPGPLVIFDAAGSPGRDWQSCVFWGKSYAAACLGHFPPFDTPFAHARWFRQWLVNINLRPVRPRLHEDPEEGEQLYLWTEGVLGAAWFLLSRLLVTPHPRLVQCRDPKCQNWVVPTDQRQHFCAAPRGKRESRCSARYRMRNRRARASTVAAGGGEEADS